MPQSNTISILCVDDEPLFLDAFKQKLEREAGITVTTVSTVADALELLNSQYFDVIISDYAMPDMDGLALLQEIRARGCQSLFVVVTAKRLAHIAIDALNAGADYYLQKGVESAQEINKLISFIKKSVPERNAGHEAGEWERFYQSVIENQTEVICRLNPDGTFTFINDAGIRFFKKSYEEVLRDNFFSKIPDKDRKQVVASLQDLSEIKPDALLEHQVTGGDGKPALIQWNYHGFFATHGEVVQYQVAGRDITSLTRIGQKEPARSAVSTTPPAPPAAPAASATAPPLPAKEEAADWKGLVETVQTLDNPVFAVDKKGVIIAWNKALEQLTGVTAAAMIGKGDREYAVPFYGKPAPMLIDHIVAPPGSTPAGLPAIKKVGDTYIGDVEHVKIKGKPMLLWGKGSPVYDAKGTMIAAIEAITVGEPQPGTEAEDYLGGISSITLKVSGEGVGGAIAGAIGSSTGGFGVYATSRRMFIIRNPELNAENPQGVQFGTFIMDELFGTTVDTRQKSIPDLERLRVFEAEKDDIEKIELKKPVLLSGYMTITMKDKSSFRIYIDHKKAFTHIEQLMKTFSPENLKVE
jgi:PAS domain S-box-containing protein